MLYKKILSLFKALPEESLKLGFIEYLTRDEEIPTKEHREKVKPLLEQLVREGHIKGKRSFRLIGEHKTSYLKNAAPPNAL